MGGWIKISRDITKHWLWQDAEKCHWWFDLLFMASYENRKELVGNKLISLEKGQLVASRSFLSQRWERNIKTIDVFLSLLVEGGLIKRETIRNISIITILNYDGNSEGNNDYIAFSVDENSKKNEEKKADTKTGTKTDYLGDDINNNKSASYNSKDGSALDDLAGAKTDYLLDTKTDYLLDTIKRNKEINNNNIPTNVGLSSLSDDAPFSSINFKDLIVFFNSQMANKAIPQIRSIEGNRKAAVIARLKAHGKDAIAEVITNAANSEFLNGGNDRAFIATFDWIFKPNNFPKVLEGNYNNHAYGTTHRGYNQQKQQSEQRIAEAATLIASLDERSKQGAFEVPDI